MGNQGRGERDHRDGLRPTAVPLEHSKALALTVMGSQLRRRWPHGGRQLPLKGGPSLQDLRAEMGVRELTILNITVPTEETGHLGEFQGPEAPGK